ncbi:coiled-coil domain-containing protein 39-like [Cynoglossus semilaevis]|uniref:Coiled-coil domain-containing protein 39 n=1 Tax=Cynoglossus semilaevis TaxID=244447 RepID=A0A3P8VQC3_CYNSE|nr:coiled-coil domain-containing protein 39-like [Cynoglossus semilaevis]
MANVFDSVLSNIGWDESFAIPEPNAENKALLEEIRIKETKLTQLKNKHESTKSQKQFINEFLRNGKQELDHIDALCKAKERERDLQNHLTALAVSEASRLTQDITKMEKELQYFEERGKHLGGNILKTKEKLEEFKEQMNWDQQAMDTFLEESARKDKETMAIIKYSQQDEQKIKSLSLAMEKSSLEANEKRKLFEQKYAETVSTQLALDKAAEILWQAHQETQQLIKQWENTVMQMQKRDAEMQQCAEQLEQSKQNIREMNATITVRMQFLETQKKNNKQIERKVTLSQQQVLIIRQDLETVENKCSSLQHDLDCCKGTLDKANTSVKTVMSNIGKMKDNVQENNKKIEEAKDQNTALEEKLQDVTHSTFTEEERAEHMEQFLKEEEMEIRELDLHLNEVVQELSRNREHLHGLKSKEKDSITNISRSRYTITCLKSELRKLQRELLKHQMNVNEQESNIICLSRKLARLQGDIKLEELHIFLSKIAELNKMVDEKQKTATMLSQTLKQSEDDIRFLKKEIEKSRPLKRSLNEKVEELMLIDRKSDSDLKKLRLKKQDSMVEQNIIKLKVKRVRDQLYNKADFVLSLEKRKLELQRDIKEREEELKVYREIQSQKLRILEQERQRIRVELNDKLVRIEVTKKRCEIMTFSFEAPEGEEDKWHAHSIVKIAQEKEELRRKGDCLDSAVCTLELENKALENVILRFSNSNTIFRKSLNKEKELSPEYREKVNLEKQLSVAADGLKNRKREVEELKKAIENINCSIESLLLQERTEKDKIVYKESIISKMNRELNSLHEKIERASRQCSRLSKEIRAANDTKGETFEEKDIKLKELKGLNKNGSKMLHEALEDKPDLRLVLEQYFTDAQLSIPTTTSTSSSLRSSKTSSS